MWWGALESGPTRATPMREGGTLRVAQKHMQGLGLQLAPPGVDGGCVFFCLSVCRRVLALLVVRAPRSPPPPTHARLAAAASHPGIPAFTMNVVLFR